MNGEFSDDALPQPVSLLELSSVERTYTLGLQVSPSQAVHVLVEVHHLEAVELVRNLLYLLLLARLLDFDALGIPMRVPSVSVRGPVLRDR